MSRFILTCQTFTFSSRAIFLKISRSIQQSSHEKRNDQFLCLGYHGATTMSTELSSHLPYTLGNNPVSITCSIRWPWRCHHPQALILDAPIPLPCHVGSKNNLSLEHEPRQMAKECSSVLKKRHKKMKKHKYRKWRKRMRFKRRALK